MSVAAFVVQFDMPSRSSAATIAGVLLLLSVTSSCARAQQPAGPAIPRTADGKPNLQGMWQVRNSAAVNLEDHVSGPLEARRTADLLIERGFRCEHMPKHFRPVSLAVAGRAATCPR